MSDNLKQKMIGALTWSTIDRFGQQFVQLVFGIILARLLSPKEFGLIGMLVIFSSISFVLVESGFGLALIRKQDTSEKDYNSVFYFNIFVSIFLYLFFFFLTPAIADFFNQPQLVLLGRVVFLSILFNALYLIPYNQLGKAMDFKTLAKVNLLSTLLSGSLGVTLAFLEFGVWSLVAQSVSYQFFRMLFFHSFVKWKPKLIFSFSVIRELWKFSLHILGTSVLNVIFNNLYVLMLSKFYPIQQVGYFTQANKLSETFNFTFQSILVGSTYSLFSQIQNDLVRFRRIFREIVKKTSIVTFPVFLILIAIAKPFIYVLLSEQWMPAVSYFQLLCLSALFLPLYMLTINALNSRGESKITFRIELIKKALILISILASFRFGVLAMLWGYAVASFIAFAVSSYYLKKNILHYYKHQFNDFSSAFLIGLSIAVITYSLSFLFDNNYFLLAIQLFTALLLYILSIKIFHKDLFTKTLSFVGSTFSSLKNNFKK
jgi:O-antigen/teichoic acid export membrane protein